VGRVTLAGRGIPGGRYYLEALVLELDFPYIIWASFRPYRTGLRLDTIPPLGSQMKMARTLRETLGLVNRTKKVIGQLEAIFRALNDDEQYAEFLQRLAAARGTIHSLTGELREDQIRNHLPRDTGSSDRERTGGAAACP